MAIIPKHHRKHLKSIGYPKWFWTRTWDWMFGERYKFRDDSIAYVKDDKIVTIRYSDKILWRREQNNG